MKFMVMVHHDETQRPSLSPEELARVPREHAAHSAVPASMWQAIVCNPATRLDAFDNGMASGYSSTGLTSKRGRSSAAIT
jgi:hypothetical protein